jgi:uncharacterized membrane-anchored protein
LFDEDDGSPVQTHPFHESGRPSPVNDITKQALSKVPAVTLGFWVIKILATTLGETGGDTVTMTIFHADKFRNWGYLVGVALFGGVLVALVVAQIFAKRFHPTLYWATIVASTTFGTTLADFADRSLGIGYTGGSLLLLCCLLATLGLWQWSEGTVSVNTVSTPKVEAFYWATITFSQTLGTALGDWVADTGGLGYEGGALVFTAGLVAVAALYYWTSVSRVTLFWVAFILTRPLGATVGDFLDKPVSHGGLDLSRPVASAVIAAIIVALLILLPQRPGRHPGEKKGRTAVGAESVRVDDSQPTDGTLPNQDASVGAGNEASRDDKSRRRSRPVDG